MYSIYVLKSLKNSKRYIGFTSKDSRVRLGEHNRGCNKWARENKPFVLLHTEPFDSKRDAQKREKFLKSGQGRKWLDKNNIK
ncbi:GIY-YIG nuclease family protein [Patescibacteria group bacterium]|nr:GIY-YIG nuclease family protein [Patescibacteria group bacterium]